MGTKGLLTAIGAGLLAGLAAFAGAAAAEPCGLCDETIVTNSALAQCFLDEYPFLAGKAGGPIVVDLSACEQQRSIVPPLGSSGEQVPEPEPSVQFVVTRTQLECLKTRLEQKDVELDPSATIELDTCQ